MPNSDIEGDPLGWVRKLSESYGRIKFGRGVVGKTSYAMIALLIVWGVVIWKMSGNWFDLFPLFGGCIATGVFVWWTRSTQDFAQRNEAQAMLEGAEFLEYRKFEAEAKGGLTGPNTLTNDPMKPLPAAPLDEMPD
jgi:hypothetical protein